LYSVSSYITLGNSTLGSITNEKLYLDLGSEVKLVNIVPPSDTNFVDEGSSLEYWTTIEVTLVDYEQEDPIAGGQVDLKNVDGNWIATGYTGSNGQTDPIMVKVIESSRSGSFSHLPITILAYKEGYEISAYDIEKTIQEVTINMYPPNNAPTISIIGPVNGTVVVGSIPLEGRITDDLGIYSLKIRFDEGYFRTFEGIDPDSGGYFTISIPVGNISNGIHTIWVYAFDHTHISTPETRSVFVIDPEMNDTDEDGIPDIEEDSNGNGIWDEGEETDPNNPDTDGDLLKDGTEIDVSDGNSTDPLDPDTDGDFLTDGFEDQNMNGRVDVNETDPNLKDTDGDGIDDREDMYPLDPFRTGDVADDDDSTAVIILATLFLIGLIIAIYLLIVKMRGAVPTERVEPRNRPVHGDKGKDRRDTEDRVTPRRHRR
jgi:hypothetical protein